MGTVVNMYEAKTHLSQLVARVEAGEEIVIAKAGKPCVRLMPLARTPVPAREPGGWSDGLWVADDFDAPLPPDLLDAFEGRRR